MTMRVFEVIKMVLPRNKNNYHNKLFQAIFNYCINHPEIVLSLGKYLMKVKIYLVHSNWTYFLQIKRFSWTCAIACYLMPIVYNHTIDKY